MTASVLRAAQSLTLRPADIEIPPNARPCVPSAVSTLAESIAAMGLQTGPDGHRTRRPMSPRRRKASPRGQGASPRSAGRCHSRLRGPQDVCRPPERGNCRTSEAEGAPAAGSRQHLRSEFARWIKLTTPNDRPHVIDVLEMTAAILQDELEESEREDEAPSTSSSA